MPCEIVILSPTRPDDAGLLQTAQQEYPDMRVAEFADGAVTQLESPDGEVVLTVTVNAANHVRVPGEASRLLGDAAAQPPVWWIEIFASWPHAEQAIRVARHYASSLCGQCHVLRSSDVPGGAGSL